MTVSFYTIQSNDASKWQVVHKTFPQSPGRFTVQSSSEYSDFCNAEIAELMANLLAHNAGVQYVPLNTTVLAVIPYIGKNFMTVELHPSGSIKAQSYSPDLEAALRKAKALSNLLQYPLVLPKSN